MCVCIYIIYIYIYIYICVCVCVHVCMYVPITKIIIMLVYFYVCSIVNQEKQQIIARFLIEQYTENPLRIK